MDSFLDLQVATQSQHGIGLGIKREVFFLNLEDGYFGCQVNDSTEVLQLYELSKLCDGVQDCYKGSDELRKELKCTSNYTYIIIFSKFTSSCIEPKPYILQIAQEHCKLPIQQNFDHDPLASTQIPTVTHFAIVY